MGATTKALPEIGARWTPGEAVRIDTATGRFEHLNARLHNDADSLALQRVLLAPGPRRGNGRVRGWLLAIAMGGALAAVLFFGWSNP